MICCPTSNGPAVPFKAEGVAFLPSGETFVMTDNDGFDDASGETMFWPIGSVTPGN